MDRRAFMQMLGATAGGVALGAPLLGRSRAAWGADMPELGKISYQLSWIKNFQFGGEYIAEYKHYYKDFGIEVELLAGGPSVAVDPIVASGKALVGQSAPDFMANSISQGASLKCVGANYQKSPYCMISLAGKEMKTPQDMLGKKIGIQTANQVLWQAFLKLNKIDPAKLTTVPVQFDHAPLISGEVDGFFGYSNDDVVEVKSKGHDAKYFLFADYGYKMFTAIYIVTTDTLADKKKRAQLVAFMKGDIKGWQDGIKDFALQAKLTTETYGKELGLDPKEQEQSASMTNELMLSPDTEKHGLFWMTDEAIAETITTLAAAGVKATPDMFTNEILAEAYQGKPRI